MFKGLKWGLVNLSTFFPLHPFGVFVTDFNVLVISVTPPVYSIPYVNVSLTGEY